MSKCNHLVIIFQGNTFAILNGSGEPIQKVMDKITITRLKDTVMECINNFQGIDGETEIIKLLNESKKDKEFGSDRVSIRTRIYNSLVRAFQELGIQYASQVKDHCLGEFYRRPDFGHTTMRTLKYFLDKYGLKTKK